MSVDARTQRSLDRVDAMAGPLRACVHDFGLPIVEAFIHAGVTSPGAIRNIVGLCWSGAAATPSNGRRGIAAHIDALLLREGGAPHADALAALLRHSACAILPITATAAMVKASMAETDRHGTLSRERKHMVRLNAALRAGAAEAWPRVWSDG